VDALLNGRGEASMRETREESKSGGGGEDVEDLLKKLAAAEAEAKAAKEETASWKVKHGELRAFVAAELVNDAASK
jgi:hypothetical protein